MILIDFAKFLEYMFVLRESAYKENGKWEKLAETSWRVHWTIAKRASPEL